MEARKKAKLVYGVGVNDEDYPMYVSAKVGGRHKKLWTCPIYRTWKDMLGRCYNAKCHAKHPTYIGCTVAPEWLSFSAFRAWMLAQEWEGKELDKDILIQGNKVYGPDACVFVPANLNLFMNDNRSVRGEWPTGVSWHKASGKFSSRCCNPFTGKREQLGLFTCPDAAHEAWRQRKYQHACAYADQQADRRIAQALRANYIRKQG